MNQLTENNNPDERLQRLEAELELIKHRNTRVEADKAWETSRFRIISICVLTYFLSACMLYAIGGKRPWIDGVMPVLGFFISSRSLRLIKSLWVEKYYKKHL
jgi:hypothetical protein